MATVTDTITHTDTRARSHTAASLKLLLTSCPDGVGPSRMTCSRVSPRQDGVSCRRVAALLAAADG